MVGFRSVSVLALCIFLTTNFASVIHRTTVLHATCPDHGEAVHVGGGDVGGLEVRAEGAGFAEMIDGRPGMAGDSSTSCHEHEHCFNCETSRERLILAPDSLVVAFEFARRVDVALAIGSSYPLSFPLYLLAPKQSPPDSV